MVLRDFWFHFNKLVVCDKAVQAIILFSVAFGLEIHESRQQIARQVLHAEGGQTQTAIVMLRNELCLSNNPICSGVEHLKSQDSFELGAYPCILLKMEGGNHEEQMRVGVRGVCCGDSLALLEQQREIVLRQLWESQFPLHFLNVLCTRRFVYEFQFLSSRQDGCSLPSQLQLSSLTLSRSYSIFHHMHLCLHLCKLPSPLLIPCLGSVLRRYLCSFNPIYSFLTAFQSMLKLNPALHIRLQLLADVLYFGMDMELGQEGYFIGKMSIFNGLGFYSGVSLFNNEVWVVFLSGTETKSIEIFLHQYKYEIQTVFQASTTSVSLSFWESSWQMLNYINSKILSSSNMMSLIGTPDTKEQDSMLFSESCVNFSARIKQTSSIRWIIPFLTITPCSTTLRSKVKPRATVTYSSSSNSTTFLRNVVGGCLKALRLSYSNFMKPCSAEASRVEKNSVREASFRNIRLIIIKESEDQQHFNQ